MQASPPLARRCSDVTKLDDGVSQFISEVLPDSVTLSQDAIFRKPYDMT